MPYKRRNPVPEAEMDGKRWEGHHTICQFLRDIYHMTNDPNIKMKARIGVSMAKAMNKKLQWYKAKEQGLDVGLFSERYDFDNLGNWTPLEK